MEDDRGGFDNPAGDSGPADTLLTPRQLAARWGLAVHTLENWRSGGRGPAHLKVGHSVRYRLSDVLLYETAALKPGGETGTAPATAG